MFSLEGLYGGKYHLIKKSIRSNAWHINFQSNLFRSTKIYLYLQGSLCNQENSKWTFSERYILTINWTKLRDKTCKTQSFCTIDFKVFKPLKILNNE